MSDWVYVLELSPPGYVKVGQSTNLPKRLNDHMRAVGMSGAAVTRIFSVASEDADTLERMILKQVTEMPGAVVVNGREIFAGVTFLEVATIADRAAGIRYKKARVRPPVEADVVLEVRDILWDVRQVLGADQSMRASRVPHYLREMAPTYVPSLGRGGSMTNPHGLIPLPPLSPTRCGLGPMACHGAF